MLGANASEIKVANNHCTMVLEPKAIPRVGILIRRTNDVAEIASHITVEGNHVEIEGTTDDSSHPDNLRRAAYIVRTKNTCLISNSSRGNNVAAEIGPTADVVMLNNDWGVGTVRVMTGARVTEVPHPNRSCYNGKP